MYSISTRSIFTALAAPLGILVGQSALTAGWPQFRRPHVSEDADLLTIRDIVPSRFAKGCFDSRVFCFISLLVSVASAAEHRPEEPSEAPQWIWCERDQIRPATVYLARSIDVADDVQHAQLQVVVDHQDATVYLNGNRLRRIEEFGHPLQRDVTRYLHSGVNHLVIMGVPSEGPAAIGVKLEWEFHNGHRSRIISDSRWHASTIAPKDLNDLSSAARGWLPATTFGNVEPGFFLISDDADTLNPFDEYNQWEEARGESHAVAIDIRSGFEIDRLLLARPEDGSWVSLAADPQGRWIIAKEAKGLLRATLSSNGNPPAIKVIDDQLQECRGLVFAYGSLYANANNSKGLYRLTDTNGDGQFDEVTLLRSTEGDVGHGRNDLCLGLDGPVTALAGWKRLETHHATPWPPSGDDGYLYAIHGDSVIVASSDRSLVPIAQPTAREKGEPTGHVIRFDELGKDWCVVARGLRNPFGIDFNTDGEMFTYDADAEAEIGLPWYRPTSVYHVVSGADYGWRQGDWKLPQGAADSLPPILKIGRGSPTAVKFAYRSQFPSPYQQALFVLDWAYGRVLAVHLSPRGASYRCWAETFLRGRPLNVTDLEFGGDGAMYFITGGRGTQSALYRVRYVGPRRAASSRSVQARARHLHAHRARTTRRQLESLHGRNDPSTVEQAWQNLGHSDPWIRHAARVVLEHQPSCEWSGRAMTESQPGIAVTALLALSRMGQPELLERIAIRLSEIPWQDGPSWQKLTGLRVLEQIEVRGVALTAKLSGNIIEQLAARFPDEVGEVNRALCSRLAALQAPGMVETTLRLVANSADDQARLHYLAALRNLEVGWSDETRKTYLAYVDDARFMQGDAQVGSFVTSLKEAVLASLKAADRPEVIEWLNRRNRQLESPPLEAASPRSLVREWTLPELVDLPMSADRQSIALGKELYVQAQCANCHRFQSMGRTVGPDLTTVAHRFGRRDLLQAILEPSRVIPEQYRVAVIAMNDGQTIAGRVVHNLFRDARLTVAVDPQNLDSAIEIAKSDIESHTWSPISPMPAGLLNTLTRKEIANLLAFLESSDD